MKKEDEKSSHMGVGKWHRPSMPFHASLFECKNFWQGSSTWHGLLGPYVCLILHLPNSFFIFPFLLFSLFRFPYFIPLSNESFMLSFKHFSSFFSISLLSRFFCFFFSFNTRKTHTYFQLYRSIHKDGIFLTPLRRFTE